jgi:hypothetical protein
MRAKTVSSALLHEDGRRLDCGPYMSGALEARALLGKLSERKETLQAVTLGGARGIFNGPRFARSYTTEATDSIPFLGSTDRLISQSTDSEESIAARLEFIEKRFFDAVPDIEPKDPQRGFSHEQRLAIFRRDGGFCQLKLRCEGNKVTWDHWHADHKVPHSKGGKSIVANGQVACPDCNFAKGASAPVVSAAE